MNGNDTIQREADTRRSFIKKSPKTPGNLFGHMIRVEKMEHFVTIGMIEGKHSKRKLREKMLDNFTEIYKASLFLIIIGYINKNLWVVTCTYNNYWVDSQKSIGSYTYL